MSGWSPYSNHNPNIRQVAYYSTIYHYSGYPGGGPGTPSGQYWVHAQGAGNLEGGDSGGPLFWQKPDGTRQVLGVAGSIFQHLLLSMASIGTFNKCDIWTDVTRDNIARWVRDRMVDTSRSPAWMQAHGKTSAWWGEVDYVGACLGSRDRDCDHWFDEHDTCPKYYNPGQTEGQAGPSPPPPSVAPQNCRSDTQCGDVITLRCDSVDAVGTLERLVGNTWHAVGIVDPSMSKFLFPMPTTPDRSPPPLTECAARTTAASCARTISTCLQTTTVVVLQLGGTGFGTGGKILRRPTAAPVSQNQHSLRTARLAEELGHHRRASDRRVAGDAHRMVRWVSRCYTESPDDP